MKRILSLEFNRLLEYYKDAPTIDFIDEKPTKEKNVTYYPEAVDAFEAASHICWR